MAPNNPPSPPPSSTPPADPPGMQALDLLIMGKAIEHANQLEVDEPPLVMPTMPPKRQP